MKRLVIMALCMLLMMMPLKVQVYALEDVRVELNDKFMEFDVLPTIINGRTMLPVRAILEAFGLEVGWNQSTKTVTGKNDRVDISLQIDNTVAHVNGKEIILDQPAIIKEGRTLVPVRFIAESTGAVVYWKNEERIVDIWFDESLLPAVSNEQEVVVSLEMQEKIEALNKKIDYVYDERVFTLYAFMNLTGFDAESSQDGYSEVRELVRADLEAMDIELYDNDYYTTRNVDDSDYGVINVGLPPYFNYLDNYRMSGIEDLNIRLKEFYEKADIHILYEKYRPYYEEELEKYKTLIQEPIIEVLEYIQVENTFDNIYIQVNLLNSHWTGSGLGGKDEVLGFGITTGPSKSPNIHNILHEFMHGIVNPITDKNKNKINSTFGKLGEENTLRFVNESLVQAVALIGSENAEDMLANVEEYMVTYFYNNLIDDYPDYDGSFEEFCVWMIENY